MCDDSTKDDNKAYLSRRSFATMTTAGILAMMAPKGAFAGDLVESDIVIKTPDGQADCYFVHPANTTSPAVLIWPDILGLRPAFRAMGKRLAAEGYAVLVVNPFYRSAKSPVVKPGATFADQAVREHVIPMAKALSATTHKTDAAAFVGFLDGSKAVDTSKKMGTTGYCMGGPIVFRTAASQAGRVGAAATFHGGGLVTDAADSPHLSIGSMKAQFLIAVAENDDKKDATVKETLKKSFEASKLKAEVEVYAGAMHGWCPPDSAVYEAKQAERAWARLLVLLKEALV